MCMRGLACMHMEYCRYVDAGVKMNGGFEAPIGVHLFRQLALSQSTALLLSAARCSSGLELGTSGPQLGSLNH